MKLLQILNWIVGVLIIAENLPKPCFGLKGGKTNLGVSSRTLAFHPCTSSCSPKRTLWEISFRASKCSEVGLNINLVENLQVDLKRTVHA